MAEAEHVLDLEVFFSSQRPLLNPVEKMIPGLVSKRGQWLGLSWEGAILVCSGLLLVLEPALANPPVQHCLSKCPLLGLPLGTTAATAGKGILAKGTGQKESFRPTFTWHWNNSVEKGNSLPNCQVSTFHRYFAGKNVQEGVGSQGPDKTGGLSLNPVDPSDCQGFPL